MSDNPQGNAALIQELLKMVDEFLRHMAALEAENRDLRAQLVSWGKEPGGTPEAELATALVVDPEPQRAAELMAMLGRAGCRAESVATGDAALHRLGRARFSLLVLESELGGESGLDLLERLREAAPETECLIVVGFTSADIAVQALRRGASAFCLRPVQEEELAARVREALGRQAIEQRSKRYLNDLRTRYERIASQYQDK